MSGTREENVRLRISTVSDLPSISENLEEIIRLNKQLLEQAHQNALSSRVDAAMQVTAIGGVTDALKAQQKAGKEAGDSTAEGAKKGNAELDKLAGQVRNFATLVATAFTFDKIKQFGEDIIETKTKIDSLKIALDVMLGSKAESAKLYEEFVKLAKTTPFTLEEVAEQGVKLKAYNIATADIIPTINALGNMAAAVGKEKLPQLTLAYGQVANTGKLMGTEIKQFTEAGIPLFDLLARAMNKPKEAVIELANAHQISFAEVRKAIMLASQQGGQYADLMILQSKTLGGQVSNLADSYFVAKGRIGDFFEGPIKKGVGYLNDLVGATIGSNSAIERTLDIVKAAVTTFVAYQAATRGAAIQSTALAAAEAAKAAIVGTTNLVMITLKGTTEGFTRAQLESAVASRTLWASLSANPVGALIATVSLLATAYYALKAANEEVVSQLGEEEVRLKTEQANLNSIAEAALNAAEGSKQRKDAIELLIKNYPQYFSGLNSEKTSNAQLKSILDSVNQSYAQRIDLAREAYKTEGIASKQKEFFQAEEAFFNNLQEKFSKGDQTLAPFDGSVKKLIETLKGGGKAAEDLRDKLDDAFGNGAKLTQLRAQQILNGFIQIEKQSTESAARTAKINEESHTAEVNAIKAKYDVLEAQAAGNSKKLAALKTQEAAEIASIEKKSSEISYNNTVKTEETKAAKQKEITLLTGKEIAVIEKGFNAETLAEKLKLLNAQQAAEIDSVRKIKVARKTSDDEIAQLREEAERKVVDIIKKYDTQKAKLIEEDRDNSSRSMDVDIRAFQKNQNERVKTFQLTTKEHNQSYKEMADEAEKYEKEIQETTKETAKIRKETTKEAQESLKDHLQMAGQLAGSLASMFAQNSPVAGLIGSVFQQGIGNLDIFSGKSKQVAQDTLKNAQDYYEVAKVRYADAGKEGEAAIAKAGEGVAKAEQGVQKTKTASVSAALGLAGTIIEIAQVIGAQLDAMNAQLYTSISQGLGQALQAYDHFYEVIESMQRDALGMQLDQQRGNLKEQLKLIDEFFDKQAEQAKNKNYFESMLNTSKQYADALAAAGRDTVYNHAKYTQIMAEATIAIERNRHLQEQQMLIDNAQLKIEKAKQVLAATIEAIDAELDAFKEAKQAEIDAAEAAADQQIEAIKKQADTQKIELDLQLETLKDNYNKQTDAVKDSYDKQLDALKEKERQEREQLQATYELKQQLLEQSTSDEVEKIGIVDRARIEALERYRVDEVARLMATRDRILATLTDEGERARVTAEYEQRIKDVHSEVETAKLDKSKGVSLATTQLRNEEKEEATRLKEEEKTRLAELETNYQTLFTNLANDRDALLTTLKDQYLSRETDLKDKIKTLEQETKDKVEAIQIDLKDQITKLQTQIKDQEQKAAADKTAANENYATAVIAANKAIFEANKQMAILELKAQIAILESKKSWTGFGNGKINDAQNDIRAAIGQIEGQYYSEADKSKAQNDAVGIAAGLQEAKISFGQKPSALRVSDASEIQSAFDEKGNVIELSYNRSGKRFMVYDNLGQPFEVAYADGYAPATGRRYFRGTEYLERDGQPAGIDTIPIWANEGERIIATDKNKMMGDISNEEVVDRVINYDKLMEKVSGYEGLANQFPSLFQSMGWQDIANAQISMPRDIAVNQLLTQSLASPFDTDRIIRSVKDMQKELVSTIKNKTETHLAIDKNGFSTALVNAMQKTEYINNLFNRP